LLTGTKDIKKVTEARLRKKKRAATMLKTAKKSATAMAENSEMSEKQKLKVHIWICIYTHVYVCIFIFKLPCIYKILEI
jgi:hypothetical protein